MQASNKVVAVERPLTPALVPSSSAGGLPTELSEDVHLTFVVIDGGVKKEASCNGPHCYGRRYMCRTYVPHVPPTARLLSYHQRDPGEARGATPEANNTRGAKGFLRGAASEAWATRDGTARACSALTFLRNVLPLLAVSSRQRPGSRDAPSLTTHA